MHIVVVDPSRVTLKMISRLLSARGHTVSAFIDSQEALAFLSETPDVSALITSLEVLPLRGLDLCWSARQATRGWRPMYIIVMSSHEKERSLGEAIDSGADDFISKPPIAEELFARLRAGERVIAMQRELIRLAETDSLSGVLNRRGFLERLRAEASRRAGRPLSLVLADVDHFKRVNDDHGHDVGDRVIHTVAQDFARDAGDRVVGRLGGEEFALALPGVAAASALKIAGWLRLRCAELRIPSRTGPIRITCSFGVAELSPGESPDDLIKRADVALYNAKRQGRDRAILAESAFDIAMAQAS